MSKKPPPISKREDDSVQFFETPGVDMIYRTCLALAEELAVTQDRLDTLERVLSERGLIEGQGVDQFEPDAEAESEKRRIAARLSEKVLAPIKDLVKHYEVRGSEAERGGPHGE